MKIASGNPGKRRLNGNEPKPSADAPACPKHIKGAARREWFKVSAILAKVGLLSDHFSGPMAMYCAAYGRWCEAEIEVAKQGVIVKSPNGYPIQNPYLAVANKAIDQMIRLSAGFGMTPAELSRVTIKAEPTVDDEDERMLG